MVEVTSLWGRCPRRLPAICPVPIAYELHGDQLTFGQMASTRMACLEGGDTEQAFLEALRHVRTWKITGQHLELFDAAGILVARFEARHMQ